MVVDVIRYYAGAVDKFFGHTIPVERDGVALTFREPIGVVGLITPWNFPLNIANWKAAPALAAGNAVVLKPASLTPLSVLRYAELAVGAGRRRRGRPGRASAGRQDRVHRLDGGGCGYRPCGRRDDQAGDTRAGRQVGVRGVRRRRPREGRPARALRGVRELRPGLLRPVAAPGAGVGQGG